MSSGRSIRASLGVYEAETLPTRSAIIYVLAVAIILITLVCGYFSLFKPQRFENPGLGAYRAPPGITTVHPLVWAELVPTSEAAISSGTETVGITEEETRARSAMAFSDAGGLRRRDDSMNPQVGHLGKPRSWRRVVMTLSRGRGDFHLDQNSPAAKTAPPGKSGEPKPPRTRW
jgi:hypothetical protein